MPRTLLTDEYWTKLKPILHDCRIYDKPDLRLTIEGILYKLRTGCTWRDVPKEFGSWNAIFKRFNDWSRTEKLFLVFQILSKEKDLEWIFIDGSIIKVHQHATGAAQKSEQGDHAIGKSVAGYTTKIHMAVDSMGNPIDFIITGGEAHDVKIAPHLIERLPRSDFIIADKGYDSESLRQQIRDKNSIPMIPKKKNSKTGNNDMDWHLYKYRHLVENFFARLKHFKSIATRLDKLKRNFKGMLSLACAFIWLPL
jgi:transposase